MCKCNKIQEEHPPFGSGLRLFSLERFISMLLAGRLTAWLDNVSTLCKSTALGKISLIQHRMDFKTRLGLLHTSVLYTDRFDVPWNTITEIQRMCTHPHTHMRAHPSHALSIWTLGRGRRGGNGGAGEKITRLLGCATVYVLIHLKWLQSVRILNGLSVAETDTRMMVI